MPRHVNCHRRAGGQWRNKAVWTGSMSRGLRCRLLRNIARRSARSGKAAGLTNMGEKHEALTQGIAGKAGSAGHLPVHQRPPRFGGDLAGAGPARRGHHHALHLRLDHPRHRTLRPQARVLRRQGRRLHHRPGKDRSAHHQGYLRHPAGARLRQYLRRCGHRSGCPRARPQGDLPTRRTPSASA